MAKGSDIRGRLGPPPPPAASNVVPLPKPATGEHPDHQTKGLPPRSDMGVTPHRPAKAQGGGGGSSARPKV